MRKRRTWFLVGIALVPILMMACGGGSDGSCLPVPCALPTAVVVNVVTAGGAPITGATVQSSGAVTSTPIPCTQGTSANQCRVLGGAGTYNLRVVAPGFQTVTQAVTVAASADRCSCAVNTQTINVVLTPGSQ